MTVHSVRIILYLNELLLKWRTDSERLKSIVAPLIRARSVVQVHPGPPIFSINYGQAVFPLSEVVPNFVPQLLQKRALR